MDGWMDSYIAYYYYRSAAIPYHYYTLTTTETTPIPPPPCHAAARRSRRRRSKLSHDGAHFPLTGWPKNLEGRSRRSKRRPQRSKIWKKEGEEEEADLPQNAFRSMQGGKRERERGVAGPKKKLKKQQQVFFRGEVDPKLNSMERRRRRKKFSSSDLG